MPNVSTQQFWPDNPQSQPEPSAEEFEITSFKTDIVGDEDASARIELFYQKEARGEIRFYKQHPGPRARDYIGFPGDDPPLGKQSYWLHFPAEDFDKVIEILLTAEKKWLVWDGDNSNLKWQ